MKLWVVHIIFTKGSYVSISTISATQKDVMDGLHTRWRSDMQAYVLVLGKAGLIYTQQFLPLLC